MRGGQTRRKKIVRCGGIGGRTDPGGRSWGLLVKGERKYKEARIEKSAEQIG